MFIRFGVFRCAFFVEKMKRTRREYVMMYKKHGKEGQGDDGE
jgi:hypothetical protein